jgi:hypothetical protein
MQWASRSPVTPEPAALASSRQSAGRALGQIGGHRPVLEKLGPVVVGAADPALVDQLFGERDRRHAPVVVADEVGHARALDRRDHRLAVDSIHREWLLADDHFSGCGGRLRDFGVQVVGHADVDELDVGPFDQAPPVGLDTSNIPDVGERRDLGGIARRHSLQHRAVPEFGKKAADLAPGVGVGLRHEAVADHADVQRFGHIGPARVSPGRSRARRP